MTGVYLALSSLLLRSKRGGEGQAPHRNATQVGGRAGTRFETQIEGPKVFDARGATAAENGVPEP